MRCFCEVVRTRGSGPCLMSYLSSLCKETQSKVIPRHLPLLEGETPVSRRLLHPRPGQEESSLLCLCLGSLFWVLLRPAVASPRAGGWEPAQRDCNLGD